MNCSPKLGIAVTIQFLIYPPLQMSPAVSFDHQLTLQNRRQEQENPGSNFELGEMPNDSQHSDTDQNSDQSTPAEDGHHLMTSVVVALGTGLNSANQRSGLVEQAGSTRSMTRSARRIIRSVQPSGRGGGSNRRESESDRRLELTDDDGEDDDTDGDDEHERYTRTAELATKYKPERVKTVVAFMCLSFSGFMNFVLLAIIHDVTPRRALPDLTFMVLPQQPWAWKVGDILSGLSTIIACLCMFFHKFRWTVFRRAFLIGAILYLLRAVCLAVTFMPPSFANPNTVCIPRANTTELGNIFSRLARTIMTLGLNSGTEGKILCGDLMFSGHTVSLTTMYFVILQYSPPKLWLLRLLMAPVCYFGLVTVVISGGHYTIDVLIAYWIASHVFWSYHQVFEIPKRFVHRRTERKFSVKACLLDFCASKSVKKRRNAPMTRVWWYWVAVWFESNVPDGCLPNEIEWPLPWPEVFVGAIKNLNEKLNFS